MENRYGMDPPGEKLRWEVWGEELGVSHKEALKLGESFSEKEIDATLREIREASPDLLISLLPYQKEFLAWALNQEKSRIKGGILADETGMGKTIQAISLILTSRYLNNRPPSMKINNVKQKIVSGCLPIPQLKATLVVGLATTIEHWQNEILKHTKEGSLKVLVYHGPRRRADINELSECDIVLTTYSTVQLEHIKPCEFCKKHFHPDQIENRACGSCEIKRTYQSSLETLAMIASVELERFNEKGSKNKMKGKAIDSSKYLSPMLYAVKWNRLILHESECEADGSIDPRAIPMLQSNYKWALTGKPLERNYLINFLQVEPFSYQYCENCDCMQLLSSNMPVCKCPHRLSVHFSWWSKYVIESPCATSYPKKLMILKPKVLDPIYLRRTKHERATDIAFPPLTVFVRRDPLTAREEDFYRSLNSMDKISRRRGISDNITLLSKLRQAVDHPYLVVYEQNSDDLSTTGYVCDGCHINLEHIRSFKHPCTACINQDNTKDNGFPVCEENLSVAQRVKKALGIKRASILDQANLQKLQTSTKIDALTEEIVLMSTNDASAKGVVFCYFSEFLDLIGFFLKKSGIKCIILDNNMSLNDRKESLENFANDADCKVILMSINGGRLILDLTAASHVFLMDPWWNPIDEQQAKGRIYRLGQYKPVKVVRFIIENTIDERILDLQEKRAPDFEGAMNHSMIAPDKIRRDDLLFLLSEDGIPS